ncbi:MAG: type VI secretion system tube protein Hcp [Pseudomonadota bacterium]
MAVYLKLGDLEGSATEAKHTKWIAVESIQFGVGRTVEMKSGKLADRSPGKPSLSEMSFNKTLDPASVDLYKLAVGGQKGLKAEVDFTKIEDNKQETYLKYVLHDVIVTSYSSSSVGEGGSFPMESFSLNFSKVEFTQKTYDANNKAAGSKTGGYDLVKSEAF